MKVSELAAKAGTSATTIRFYEAEGILPPPARSANGYRHYDEADLCRARVLVSLRNLGIELNEAGQLATMCATGRCDDTMSGLADRIPARRREIADAIAELMHVDAELAAIEGALTSGGSPKALCSRKEDC